jgi:hypothetical protein
VKYLLKVPFLLAVVLISSSFICKKGTLEGHVYEIKGNRMPSPGVKLPDPKGIKTKLYIFELTNDSQIIKPDQSPFYSAINTRLVKIVETDENGYFKIKLPEGKYSLFTKHEDGRFYANSFDMGNNIQPVEVKRGKVTEVTVKVDYDAAY